MKSLMLLAAVAVLAGCGTSNKALKAEHYIVQAAQDLDDDTVTVAKVGGDLEAETEYNLRYTLRAQLPAGSYELRGGDRAGARYFVHRNRAPVTLTYKGLSLTGSNSPEEAPGGFSIDASGATSIYWHWDGQLSPAVRIPAPRLEVTISKEIDPERVRARLDREEQRQRAAREREERERIAKAEQEAAEAARLRAEQERNALRARLAQVQAQDRVQCAGAQCERAFAQAQAYLLKQADMRIQVATPTLIETYNAAADGQMQMRLLRVPTTGERWEIVLSAHCRDERKSSEALCLNKLIEAYAGFLPHMQRP